MHFTNEYHKRRILEQIKFDKEFHEEFQDFWTHVKFVEVDQCENKAVVDLMETLSKSFQNGGGLFKTVALHTHKAISQELFRSNAFFLEKLFEQNDIIKIFHEFHLTTELVNNPHFREYGNVDFFERLDDIINGGGAYGPGVRNPLYRKKLIDSFKNGLGLNAKTNVQFYESRYAWNSFFLGIYDYTLVIMDNDNNLIHILALTDTD